MSDRLSLSGCSCDCALYANLEVERDRLIVAGDRLLDVVREYAPSPQTSEGAIKAWLRERGRSDA